MKDDLTKRGVRECDFNWFSKLLQIHFKQYPAIRFYTKDLQQYHRKRDVEVEMT